MKTTCIVLLLFTYCLIVGSSSINELCKIKKSLSAKFKVVDASELSHFLGMQFIRGRKLGTMAISQEQYIKDISVEYDLQHCIEISVSVRAKLPGKCLNEKCRQVAGILMHLAHSTRPDILLLLN